MSQIITNNLRYIDFNAPRTATSIDIDILNAVHEGNFDVLKKYILEGAIINQIFGNGIALIQIAIATDHKRIVRLLLHQNINLNELDKNGVHILHTTYSHKAGHYKNDIYKIFKLLIYYGVNINIQNKNGDTLLHRSIFNRLDELSKLLIKQGADFHILDNYKKSPAMLILEKELVFLYEILIEKGVDVNLKDRKNNTFLHSQYIKPSVAEILIKKGADVNAENNFGNTPIQLVHNLYIVKLLVKNGANIHRLNSSISPLNRALSYGYTDMAYYLLKKGADVNRAIYKNPKSDKPSRINIINSYKRYNNKMLLRLYPIVISLVGMCIMTIQKNNIDTLWLPPIILKFPNPFVDMILPEDCDTEEQYKAFLYIQNLNN